MVYGIFKKNTKPNSRYTMAIPLESGFKSKESANKFLRMAESKGYKGYKVVRLK